MQAAVEARIDDTDWSVRRQLAASLGELPVGAREPAIAAMLEKHGDDPIVVDAAISGLRGIEPAVLKICWPRPRKHRSCGAALTMLAATVVRGAAGRAVQDVFDLVARDATPAWQRSALLRGAEGALIEPGDADRARRGPGAARWWRWSRGRRSRRARSARRTRWRVGVPGTRTGGQARAGAAAPAAAEPAAAAAAGGGGGRGGGPARR